MCSFFRNLLTIVVLTLVIFPQNILLAQSTLPSVISVETYAGTMSSSGFANGTRLSARFSDPIDLVYDDAGNLFIVEEDGCAIRKIDTNGQVTTFAGLPGTRGFADGTGTSARFNDPRGIAFDHEGNLIVADKDNHKIRKITPAGVVTTIAGSSQGFKNGSGTEAQFYKPVDVAIDDNGNIYVADGLNYSIRKIDPEGNVTTVTGTGSQGYQDGDFSVGSMDIPQEIELDADGNLLVIATYALRKLDFSQETISTIVGDGTGDVFTDAGLGRGNGLLIDKDETIYLVSLHSVSRVNTDNSLTLLVGNMVQGVANGDPLTARLHFPKGIVRTPEGDFLIGDKANHVIRRLVLDRPPEVLSIKRQNPATEISNITEATFRITFSEAVSGVNFADFEIKPGGSQGTIASVSWVTATTAYDVLVTDISGPGILDLDFLEQNNIADAAGKTLLSLIPEEEESYQIDSNQNPVFSSVPPTRVWEGESYRYVISTYDQDGEAVTVAAETLPSWLTLSRNTDGLVTTFAGNGIAMTSFGTGTEAGFAAPETLAIDDSGNLFVGDKAGQITKVTPGGVVSLLAGGWGGPFFNEGTGSEATFHRSYDIVIDSKQNLFVSSSTRLIKITQEGVVTSFAGGDSSGNQDGTGSGALFQSIWGLDIDSSDNIYCADTYNHTIRKITPEGVVTTIAGTGTEGSQNGTGTLASFHDPRDVVLDDDGNIYVADHSNFLIRKISPAGIVSTHAGTGNYGNENGTGTSASFGYINRIVLGTDNKLYISEVFGSVIRRVDLDSNAAVETIVGSGATDYKDGPLLEAAFKKVDGLAFDKSGNLYMADPDDNRIRKVVFSAYLLEGSTNEAGSYSVELTATDGNGGTAVQQFDIEVPDATNPVFTSVPVTKAPENEEYQYQVITDHPGDDAVVVSANKLPEWLKLDKYRGATVSTLEFTPGGSNTYIWRPMGMVFDTEGNLLFADTYRQVIVKVTPEGVFTTYAGLPHYSSAGDFADGTGTEARFDNPSYLAMDSQGNLYVSDAQNHRIRKVTPEGVVTTFAGSGLTEFKDGTGSEASFGYPQGLAFDSKGNLYVADVSNHRIRKIDPQGVVETFAGSGQPGSSDGLGAEASFNAPGGLTIDSEDNLFVGELNNRLIRKVSPQGEVTTFAGSGISGNADGTGTEASFKSPVGLAISPAGELYVADGSSTRIRRITGDGVVSTISGFEEGAPLDGEAREARFAEPSALIFDGDANLLIADSDVGRIRKLTFGDPLLVGNPGIGVADYEVELMASIAGGGTALQEFTISVVDLIPPVFNSPASVSYLSGDSGPAYLTEVVDLNPLTLALGIEKDESLFDLDTDTGVVYFKAIPDFQNPADGDQDNVYEIEIIAHDGFNETRHTVQVTVVNTTTNTAPVFGSVPETLVFETNEYEYIISTSDEDGDRVFIADLELPSWLTLSSDLEGTVSTFAGSGRRNSLDGTGVDAAIAYPQHMAIDQYDNVYVIDNQSVVRKISPDGVVSSLAGGAVYGSPEVGTGTEVRLQFPSGLTVDDQQNVYLLANFSIMKITPEGVVSYFVGSGNQGNANGTGSEAAFGYNGDLAFDASGDLYFADTDNNVIRKITPEGVVTTFAGSGTGTFSDGSGTLASFQYPTNIVFGDNGNLYVSDSFNNRIRKVSPEAEVTTLAGQRYSGTNDGVGTLARFSGPRGLTYDSHKQELYVVELSNSSAIRKVTLNGEVTTYAGIGRGYADGNLDRVMFSSPYDLITDSSGDLLIADTHNDRIRKIHRSGYRLFGNPQGQQGVHSVHLTALDGQGGKADQQFEITVNGAENPVFKSSPVLDAALSETYRYDILVASESGEQVSVSAIEKPDWLDLDYAQSAFVDTYIGARGAIEQSYFYLNSPDGLAMDALGNFYIVDASHHRILKVTAEGVVTILAGSDAGYADGAGSQAMFNRPTDLVADAMGNLFVTDNQNNSIRKISPEGMVTTLAGSGQSGSLEGLGTKASFSAPQGIDIDSHGNLYVADWGNSMIRKVSPEGNVTNYTGYATTDYLDGTLSEAGIPTPGGLAIDKEDNIYVTQASSPAIRKITPAGMVTTLAGGVSGYADGTGTSAQFGSNLRLAVDGNGNVFVSDGFNHRIRRITPEGVVTTIAGNGLYLSKDGPGASAGIPLPVGITVAPDNSLLVSDNFNDIRLVRFPDPVLSGEAGIVPGQYPVQLKATNEGGGTALQTFTIELKDLTAPIFTSVDKVSYREGTSGVAYVATTFDHSPVSYTLGSEMDEGLFSINATSGEVSFLAIPDYENPADGDGDNHYLIEVNATDGVKTAALLVTIIVTDARDIALEFISTPATSINDNELYSYQIELNDPDQGAIDVEGKTLPSWLSLKVEEAGNVSTIVGGTYGFANGPLETARFGQFPSLAVHPNGYIYIADSHFHRIRSISPDGIVSTLAGSGRNGFGDGLGNSAHFNAPTAVVVDQNGDLLVADISNHRIRRVTTAGMVTTVAGSGKQGFVDGVATDARFDGVYNLALDKAGNIYATELGNHTIRKITPEGVVSTLAGAGESGSVDGTGTLASFNLPYGIALDVEDNIYIADRGNNTVRKISPEGIVSTLAGSGSYRSDNGNGTEASFRNPAGVVVGSDGTVYVSEQNGHYIKSISGDGEVTTFSGNGTASSVDGKIEEATFNYPTGLTIDQFGNIFIAESGNYGIRKISAHSKRLTGNPKGISGSHNVLLEASDEFGTAEQSFTISVNNIQPEIKSILRQKPFDQIIHTSQVTFRVIFNKAVTHVGTEDFEVKIGDTIKPVSGIIQVDEATYEIIVSQFNAGTVDLDLKENNDIKDLSDNSMTSLVPSVIEETYIIENGVPVFSSDPVTSVRADGIYEYQVDVNDPDNDYLMTGDLVLPDWLSLSGEAAGFVSPFVGSGHYAFQDGTGTEASFRGVSDMVTDASGNIYVTDAQNQMIRKITPDGVVSTIAGSGNSGLADGPGAVAAFNFPASLAIDEAGYIYVADAYNNAIRKVDQEGNVTTIAGSGNFGSSDGTGNQASFRTPSGIDIGPDGNLYVAESSGAVIRKVTPEGVVTTFVGSGVRQTVDGTGLEASFGSVADLVIDGEGNIYATDGQGNTIRKVTPEGVVTTLAGNGAFGFNDGPGSEANFNSPDAIYLTSAGDLIVADLQNHLIRKVSQSGQVTTIAGKGSQGSTLSGFPALEAPFNGPSAVTFDSKGNLLIAEFYGHVIKKLSVGDLMLVGDPSGKEGSHDVKLQFKDEFGGLAEQTFTITVTGLEPPAKPVITGISEDTGASDSDGVTNDRNITISGTAEPNITVAVSSQYGPIRSTQADNNGDWLLDITDIDLFEIKVDLTAEAIDASGARSEKSDVFVLTPDFTAPLKPVITNISDDTGASDSDGITNDKNIKISGTAEPEAKVEVFTQYGSVRSAQADVNGDWVLDITDIDLFEIKVNLTAEAVDLAGNRSERSDAFVLTPDFTAPDKPVITGISDDTGISNTDGVTNDRNIIISGTAEPKAKVEVFTQYGPVRSTQADANGDWLLDIRDINLFEIKVNLTAEAVDLAGNRSEKSDVFVLTPDFTAPVKPVITAISDDTGASDTDGVTKDKNIIISGTAEPNVGIEVFTQYGPISGTRADANGNWLLDITGITLIELKVSLTAIAVDIAGNRSERSDEFMLTPDFTPPVRPVITGISEDTGSSDGDGITNDKHITISGTSEPNARVDIFTQYGPLRSTQADVNGDWLLDITDISLIELVINLTAEAVDLAGNGSRRSEVFVLTPDFTSPGVTIDIQKTSADGFTIMALFDEAVNGLTADGILVTGGTASDVIRHDAMSYSFVVSLSGSTADVSINANSVEDLAGNGNTVSNQLTLNLPSDALRDSFTNLTDLTKREEISLYPNPASKILTIDLSELSSKEADIYLYDANGRPVFSRQSFREKTLKLDVSAYTNGMYVIQVYSDRQLIRKKVMVRK